jgi:hypothetical protein
MMKAITAVHRRMTRKAQIQENIAFFAAAAGTAASVGLPIATGSIRPSSTPTAAFVASCLSSSVVYSVFCILLNPDRKNESHHRRKPHLHHQASHS